MRVQAYPADLRALRAYIRRLERGGLVGSRGTYESGRRIGGRPPVAAEALRLLLRNAGVISPPPRASRVQERARRVDEAARVGFGRLYRRVGETRILAYPRIEPTVAAVSGADRPIRRWQATAHFCEARILAPYQVSGDPPRPRLFGAAVPGLVPELYFGWGPATWQTTLDASAGGDE